MGEKTMIKKKFYVTTAIDYPNAEPHIGHAYQKVVADVLARWHKILGEDVWFLTGTDEHGKKIQESAQKAGKTPKKFVDDLSVKFKEAWKSLDINYNKFIRTTDKDHEKFVQEVIKKCYKKGDIYLGEYEGLYCTGCEAYYTDKDLIDGKCPLHNRVLEKLKEGSYFFKLSKYQSYLLELYKSDNFILPKERRNEVASRVKEGLKDLSISRTSFDWGIEFPLNKGHIVYVWFDALFNYISGAGKKGEYWPADIHLLGKDNGWFHAVYWPAFLKSAGYKLPKTVFIHGFLTFNGEKISKSLGNSISPNSLVGKYGTDSVRYFICRNFVFGEDGDFSEKTLIERHNSELADKLGNLISRVSALAERYGIKKCDNKLIKKLKLKEIEKHFERYEIDKALNLIFAFIDECNVFVQENKIWEESCKNKEEKLYQLADSIKAISIILWPFIPSTSEKISKTFGFKVGAASFGEIKKPLKVSKVKKSEILFKKFEETQLNKSESKGRPNYEEDKKEYGKKLKFFHNKFSKKEDVKDTIDSNTRLEFARFLKKITDETLKDYKPIEESCMDISSFIFYKFNDKLDEIIGIAGELEIPKEHVKGDVLKRWGKLKSLLVDYIDNFEKINKSENTEKSKKIEGVMTMSEVNFDEWSKLDLRVGKISKVDDIPEANKLYKLEVDLGKEIGKRTLAAGLKAHYKKDELKGKRCIVFVNLQPRKMRGINSEGMILAAVSESQGKEKVVIISPEKDIELGSRVR